MVEGDSWSANLVGHEGECRARFTPFEGGTTFNIVGLDVNIDELESNAHAVGRLPVCGLPLWFIAGSQQEGQRAEGDLRKGGNVVRG
jgi:hypothetical protein